MVTFVTAYVPFIGAFVAGAFAVMIALGAKGTTTALVMLVIVMLANGLLQNIVQPFAMGSALDLNPLVVLVLTIGAGCVFGMIGLVLAAPIASAAVHITRDLARGARGSRSAEGSAEPAVEPPRAPTVARVAPELHPVRTMPAAAADCDDALELGKGAEVEEGLGAKFWLEAGGRDRRDRPRRRSCSSSLVGAACVPVGLHRRLAVLRRLLLVGRGHLTTARTSERYEDELSAQAD